MGGMSDRPAPLADPHLLFDPRPAAGTSSSSGAPDPSAPRPSTWPCATRTGSGSPPCPPPAAGSHCWPSRPGSCGSRRWPSPARTPYRPEGGAERQYGPGETLPEILAGPDAATELAASACHTVLNGITGSIGLAPTLAALRAGRTLALANKESLIVGGPLVKELARPGQIIPVDSEHAALFQALTAGTRAEVRKLVVTASGGPFRGRTRAELAQVTVQDALAHPTWAMGPVITVNSATLVNKGLEVIEAHLLYDIPFERIEVVVHPQSYVHSMVEFTDGSTLAQATPPDMRGPIAIGLGWPHRIPDAAPAFDWSKASTWEFFPLDTEAFPAVGLARHVGAWAAPPRPSSTRPTRSASRRSWPVGCRSQQSWIRSLPWSTSTGRLGREPP